jgi:deoxyguanosine kinase
LRHEYIAIEGNIGAGKTSLATKLAAKHNGKLVLEEFADNPFLPKFYNNRDRYAFPLELSFLAERFSQLKKEITRRDMFHDVVIADYFISKSLIFSQANLDGDEYELFSKLYEIIEPTLPKPELLIYLHLSTDKLIENIRKRGRDYEQGISPAYLEEVQASYFQFIKQHESMRVLIIDTTNLDFVNNNDDFDKIDALLAQDYPKGISRITP